MDCPKLSDLPSPPQGKAGWPWTIESSRLNQRMPDGSEWSRISIVTPSFNQAKYLEETIRSVLLQGYPDLEYIIIDGGSTDGSVEIIRKYAPWLKYWISEPDRGQSEALNKGFQQATGPIVAWLNSDDWYSPEIFPRIITRFQEHPQAVVVYGDCNLVSETGDLLRVWDTSSCTSTGLLIEGNKIPQPSAFIRASALETIGGINPGLHYIMDYDLWFRLGLTGELHFIQGVLANFRHHTVSKSVSQGYKFQLETLNWFSKLANLNHLLNETQLAEALIGLNIQTALEYVYANNEADALKYMQVAIQHFLRAAKDLDFLADRISNWVSLSGQSIFEAWDSSSYYLYHVLQKVKPLHIGNSLWKRVVSKYYMQKVFHDYSLPRVGKVKMNLFKGLWYDVRWLKNRGVRSIAVKSLLGIRLSSWLRNFLNRVHLDTFSSTE